MLILGVNAAPGPGCPSRRTSPHSWASPVARCARGSGRSSTSASSRPARATDVRDRARRRAAAEPARVPRRLSTAVATPPSCSLSAGSSRPRASAGRPRRSRRSSESLADPRRRGRDPRDDPDTDLEGVHRRRQPTSTDRSPGPSGNPALAALIENLIGRTARPPRGGPCRDRGAVHRPRPSTARSSPSSRRARPRAARIRMEAHLLGVEEFARSHADDDPEATAATPVGAVRVGVRGHRAPASAAL